MRVLVLAEDFVKDEYILQPIIEAMMKSLGKPRAKVIVCKEPRFHGTSEALRWEYVRQALARHRGMVDLFLLCVDRDGNKDRRNALDEIEAKSIAEVGAGRVFLAETAWQEIEVWLLAGHDLPPEWDWQKIRSEPHPKETYYLPFAEKRGVIDLPAEGRGKLAREAALRYEGIRRKCKEDVESLHSRIKTWMDQPA